MKVKNRKLIIFMISNLFLISSLTVFSPVIHKYIESHSNHSILYYGPTKYKITNGFNNIAASSSSIINNLSYVNEYVSASVLEKQRTLQFSIIGGQLNKNTKKYKESVISVLNRTSWTKVNRYRNQAIATVNNSNQNLKDESENILKIVSFIKEHPYTYSSYLNKNHLIIPNINFFINDDKPLSTNNLNFGSSNISNNIYSIYDNNTNLNSVSLSSEEDTVSAKTISAAGSSLSKAWFHKITFNAKIVTFNKVLNTYQYAKPTSIDKTIDSKKHYSTQDDTFISNNLAISKDTISINNLSYFNSSRIALTELSSFKNSLPYILINNSYINILPNYFNTHIGVLAKATIKYNNIAQYKHNQLWYDFTIGLLITNSICVVIGYKILKRIIKIRDKILSDKILWVNFEVNTRNNNIVLEDKLAPITQRINQLDNITSEAELNTAVFSIIYDLNIIYLDVNFENFSDTNTVYDLHKVISNTIILARNKLYQSIQKLRNDKADSNFIGLNKELNRIELSLSKIEESNNIIDLAQTKNQLRTDMNDFINISAQSLMTDSNKDLLQHRVNKIHTDFAKRYAATKTRINTMNDSMRVNYELASIELENIQKVYNDSTNTESIQKVVQVSNALLNRIEGLNKTYKSQPMDTEKRKSLNDQVASLADSINQWKRRKIQEVTESPQAANLSNGQSSELAQRGGLVPSAPDQLEILEPIISPQGKDQTERNTDDEENSILTQTNPINFSLNTHRTDKGLSPLAGASIPISSEDTIPVATRGNLKYLNPESNSLNAYGEINTLNVSITKLEKMRSISEIQREAKSVDNQIKQLFDFISNEDQFDKLSIQSIKARTIQVRESFNATIRMIETKSKAIILPHQGSQNIPSDSVLSRNQQARITNAKRNITEYNDIEKECIKLNGEKTRLGFWQSKNALSRKLANFDARKKQIKINLREIKDNPHELQNEIQLLNDIDRILR